MANAAIDISGSQYQPGTEVEEEATSDEYSIWDADTLQRVRDFSETVSEVKSAREALNAQLAAAKTKLIDDGFNKDALEAAIKYARTEEDKRQNFDLTYLYCRKALGHPIQDDLFMAATQQQVKVAKQEKQQDSE